MSSPRPILSLLLRAAALLLVAFAVLRRLAGWLAGARAWAARPLGRLLRGPRTRRELARTVLPSLYDRHPEATGASRRNRRLAVVPIDRIVGTARHPSQNTADFLPLRRLRGRNWMARWQRITGALDRMELLPPVELLKVGDEYYVVDGHNRVAAARAKGQVAVDADVVDLELRDVAPGNVESEFPLGDRSPLVGVDELRQAVAGRMSRTAEHRSAADSVSRRDLAGSEAPEPAPEPPPDPRPDEGS